MPIITIRLGKPIDFTMAPPVDGPATWTRKKQLSQEKLSTFATLKFQVWSVGHKRENTE